MNKFKTHKRFAAIITIIIISSLAVGMSFKKNPDIINNQSRIKSFQKKYTTLRSFKEILNSTDAKYPEIIRVTPSGTKEHPMYHSFFFYNCSPLDCSHFDPSGRYITAMRIYIEGREVLPTDLGDIGIIDLQDNYKWTEIGHTTAWNWQQGCRLQWLPGSTDEIIWDDRSSDGKSFISRICNFKTKQTRTLPRPIYAISPDGTTGLTHDFERMKHGGTNFVGIKDKFDNQWAPKKTGIWKMDMQSGEAKLIISLDKMAKIMYPDRFPSDTAGNCLYFFREGWNPSGTRFIGFVKDVRDKTRTAGYSMTPDGEDVRYIYPEPSHNYWMNDETILDWGWHTPPGGDKPVQGYFIFKDDGSGKAKEMLWEAPNGHDSCHPNGDWILTDTYALNGYEYLYMFHLPTKQFVPLGKFQFKLNGVPKKENVGFFRVDLHPRFSPDGRLVSFDSTHEGLGRQIYIIDVGYIIDNPPEKQ